MRPLHGEPESTVGRRAAVLTLSAGDCVSRICHETAARATWLSGTVNLPLIFNTPARALFFVTGRLFGTSTHDDTFYTEGTWFIYEASRTPGEGAPILITARHVIEGATDLTIRLIRRDQFGAPKFGEYQDIELGGATDFTHHPDPSIDISVCRLAGPPVPSAQCPTRSTLQRSTRPTAPPWRSR